MTKKVILPFSKCGYREMVNGRAGGRVIVNPDVMDWLYANNKKLSTQDTIDWYLGRDIEEWKICFTLQDESTAVLFKLTFGGA